MTREDLADLGWESERDESEDQRQFRGDMAVAGRKIRFYSGRYFYEGWATVAADFDDIQAIIRATDVLLQWDQFGKHGYIVYPR